MKLLVSAAWILLLSTGAVAQAPVRVDFFGFENADFYKTVYTQLGILGPTGAVINRINASFYRINRHLANHNARKCHDLYESGWAAYRRFHPAATEAQFRATQRGDPYCSETARKIAPVLVFSFQSVANQAILERVDVQLSCPHGRTTQRYTLAGPVASGSPRYELIFPERVSTDQHIRASPLLIYREAEAYITLIPRDYGLASRWEFPTDVVTVTITYHFRQGGRHSRERLLPFVIEL